MSAHVTWSGPSGGHRRALSAAALLHALGHWSGGRGALYVRLGRAIVTAIDSGDLPRGIRLPAERVLAARLGVSRGTVVAAYDWCQEHGPIERRRGSGTWVSDPEPAPRVVVELEAGLRARRLAQRFMGDPGDLIDLGLSVVPSAEGLPGDAFRTDAGDLIELAGGHGYHPLGLPALRRRLAEWHTAAGLPTTAEQIAVTLGGQQAIALTARLLLTPGDAVVVESATYPGALDAYSRAGARFTSVGLDTGGSQPSDIARAIERDAPRLAYVVPSCHNPTGSMMPDHRRAAIAELAERADTWLVEDESLAWAAFDGATRLPIAAHTDSARVVTIGSLSKLLWGGLRVGWIRADRTVIARVGRLKAAHDLGNCAVSQVIALRLLERADEIVAMRRRQLRHGAAHLMGELATHVPEWRFREPAGGLSLWVHLPWGAADEFAQFALRHGVSVLPGNATSAREAHPDRIRLSYSEAPPRLTTAVHRLAAAWHDYALATRSSAAANCG